MKRKFGILSIIAVLAMAFMAVSCDDSDATSVAPKFGTVTLTPSKCAPGDSVLVHVSFAKEGSYFYYFHQDYTLKSGDKSYSYQIAKANCSSKHDEPEFYIVAPDKPGLYTFTFTATVSFTAGNQLYGDCNSVNTTLEVEN